MAGEIWIRVSDRSERQVRSRSEAGQGDVHGSEDNINEASTFRPFIPLDRRPRYFCD